MTNDNLELMVSKAISGNRAALEKVILSIKDLVYNLSLRMLLYPEDAKDATQEILIKVLTNLSAFRGESAFKTWVYQISSSYLLTVKGKNASKFSMSFEEYALMLDTGHSNIIACTQNQGEQNLLEKAGLFIF